MNRLILKEIMEGSYLFNEMSRNIDNYFENYQIEKWLTQSQVKMISDILLSGNKTITENRLKEYMKLQLKRNLHEKDKWQTEFDGEKAGEKFSDTIKKLSENYESVIGQELENMNLKSEEFDYKSEREFIYQTLIQKFNYLFVMKYLIRKEKKKDVKNV